jgi:queuine tRNA-ribosyltransferase
MFTISATDGAARTGALVLPRGMIRTPAFMPVGTAGTVKAMHADAVRALGADIILGNTYHLMLRPGAERVRGQGGLHRFMQWPHPILTDSGGYQVMSLGALVKVTEAGVAFASHIDGSRHMVSPEVSMQVQHALGSDIVMAFDELVALPAPPERVRAAMDRSMRWAARSRAEFDRLNRAGVVADSGTSPLPGMAPGTPFLAAGDFAGGNAAIFGIQQGGLDAAARAASAAALVAIGFDGYAIGGLAVGEGQEAMFACLDHAVGHLPADRPRYLMGVGKPDDIVGAVQRGVDMFDCVLPTRSGRNGQAFTWDGPINLRNAKFADDATLLDADTPGRVGPVYSRAYLHHLVKSDEMLGAMLLTEQNLAFYQALMAALRAAVAAGELGAFADRFKARYFQRAPAGR